MSLTTLIRQARRVPMSRVPGRRFHSEPPKSKDDDYVPNWVFGSSSDRSEIMPFTKRPTDIMPFPEARSTPFAPREKGMNWELVLKHLLTKQDDPEGLTKLFEAVAKWGPLVALLPVLPTAITAGAGSLGAAAAIAAFGMGAKGYTEKPPGARTLFGAMGAADQLAANKMGPHIAGAKLATSVLTDDRSGVVEDIGGLLAIFMKDPRLKLIFTAIDKGVL